MAVAADADALQLRDWACLLVSVHELLSETKISADDARELRRMIRLMRKDLAIVFYAHDPKLNNNFDSLSTLYRNSEALLVEGLREVIDEQSQLSLC